MDLRLELPARLRVGAGLCVGALLACAASARAQVVQGPVVDLAGVPRSLNDSGEIAGWAYFGGTDAHAAIYSNGWQNLGVPAGNQLSTLWGINNLGAAVGYSIFANNIDNGWRAIWSPGAGNPVAVLGGLTDDSFAYGINDSGAIVGCRSRSDDAYPDPDRAFLYANGTVTDLHALLATQPLYDRSCARDINTSGDVVGEVVNSGAQRGFLIRQGSGRQLVDGASYLFDAKAINDAGKVVGQGPLSGSGPAWHALVYDAATGKISGLGLVGTGALNSRANDINSRGDVVGAMTVSGGQRAFLASGGQVFDLNSLIPSGWVLQEGQSINSRGEIVGQGVRTGFPGETRYFLLTVTFTPAQRTAGLIRTVQDLVAGGVLGSGNGNALIVKLQGASQQIDLGKVGPAVNKIQAFNNQVQAFVQSGKLTSVTGQSLIDEANRIIGSLTN